MAGTWAANGTTCGNHLTTHADVLLAVGVRFADKATSSYRPGYSFSIPPTRLIHVDIDPFEIGKNYPAEVGIGGDARAVLRDLLQVVAETTPPRAWQAAPYTAEISRKWRPGWPASGTWRMGPVAADDGPRHRRSA